MPSKLEFHSDRIAKRIGEGATFAAIVEELKAAGVQTTSQNLQGWIKRRAKRLEKRAELAKSIANPVSTTQPDQP